METEDRCHLQVQPRWASPVKQPGKYLSLLDGKDREILMLNDGLEGIDADNRAILERELHRRYLTTQVQTIEHAHTEFGSTYWTVKTERGRREFVTQSLQENAQWHGPAHLMLVDVDGNRFEIRDVKALDEESQRLLARIV
jgi:hypothetical protein